MKQLLYIFLFFPFFCLGQFAAYYETGDMVGWRYYSTGQYTDNAPLTALADLETQILFEQVSIIGAPNNNMVFFDTLTSLLTPINSGDNYSIRIDMKARTNAVNSYMFVGIDIGGSQGIIAGRTITFPRGENVEHIISVGLPLFTLGTFVANGGKIIVRPADDTEIYDIGLLTKRTYEANN